MFFKLIVLNYLNFPKFPLLMILRFVPVMHGLRELPRLTTFWINLNMYPQLFTTEAKILIGTFNLHIKRLFGPIKKVLEFSSLVLEMYLNVLECCPDKTLRTLYN